MVQEIKSESSERDNEKKRINMCNVHISNLHYNVITMSYKHVLIKIKV